MCACPQTPQGALAGPGRTKRSPEVDLRKNKQDYFLQLPTALPRHQVSLCTPLLLRAGAVSTDWSCCTMRGKVFISCGLEQQTWSNSPKGAALSEAFNNLLGRYFFPLCLSFMCPPQSEHFKERCTDCREKGRGFSEGAPSTRAEQTLHWFLWGSERNGWRSAFLLPLPSQTWSCRKERKWNSLLGSGEEDGNNSSSLLFPAWD